MHIQMKLIKKKGQEGKKKKAKKPDKKEFSCLSIIILPHEDDAQIGSDGFSITKTATFSPTSVSRVKIVLLPLIYSDQSEAFR